MADSYEKKSDIPPEELNQFYRDPQTSEFVRIKPHPVPAPVVETKPEAQDSIADLAAKVGGSMGGAEGKAGEPKTDAPAVSVIK